MILKNELVSRGLVEMLDSYFIVKVNRKGVFTRSNECIIERTGVFKKFNYSTVNKNVVFAPSTDLSKLIYGDLKHNNYIVLNPIFDDDGYLINFLDIVTSDISSELLDIYVFKVFKDIVSENYLSYTLKQKDLFIKEDNYD